MLELECLGKESDAQVATAMAIAITQVLKSRETLGRKEDDLQDEIS